MSVELTEKEKRALAVGHIPSGLFIVCALENSNDHPAKMDGFLASWVQQVSFDPMLISLCIKPGRPAYDNIINKQIFSINIVGDADTTFLKHFWSGHDPEKNIFADIPHEIIDDAVILKGAKSALICRLKESSRPGDHDIIIAEVLASVVNDPASNPKVHIRKSGLAY